MNRRVVALGSLISAGTLLLAFQNCGKGFSSAEYGVSSSSSLGNGSGALSLAASSATLYTVDDLNFKVTGVSPAEVSTIKWSNVFSGTTPCVDDVNDADPTTYGVNCSVPGDLIVTVTSTGADGSPETQTLVTKVLANPSAPPTGGGKVTFTIPAGTGNKSWNAAAAPIELYIGQTLTITNGDTVDHQLHVDRYDANTDMNGHPCLHEPNPMPPGGTYDCVVTKEYDPAIDPILWDHIAGTSARFYLRAYDGAALYTQNNCAGCHGPLATSAVKGKTVAQITNAIATVPAMMAIPALKNLTAVQKQALAFALKP